MYFLVEQKMSFLSDALIEAESLKIFLPIFGFALISLVIARRIISSGPRDNEYYQSNRIINQQEEG